MFPCIAVTHTCCQICGGFHVQLIPLGLATYSKGIFISKVSARGQRGQQGKGSLCYAGDIIPLF